jgi:hypothetical protein
MEYSIYEVEVHFVTRVAAFEPDEATEKVRQHLEQYPERLHYETKFIGPASEAKMKGVIP